MRKKIHWSILTCTLSCIAIASCSNGTTENQEGRREIVYTREDNRYRLAIGETNQLTASAYGTKTNKLTYRSSDENILTVDDKGLVTGVSEGSAYITIQSKDDENLYETADYTVCKDFFDTFPAVKEMADSFKNYDYSKGMHFDCNVNLNVGQIGVYGLLGEATKTEIIDTDQSGKGIDFPFTVDLQKDKEENDMFFHASSVFSEIVDGIIEDNTILQTISQYGSTFGLDLEGSVNEVVASLFDEDFSTYLLTSDYDDLYSIDLYNFGDSEYYTSLNRDYSDDESKDIHPYAFENESVGELLAPYSNDIFAMLLSKYLPFIEEDEDISSDSMKIEIGGVTIDLSKFMTADGALYLMELLNGYIETKEENNVTTYTMKDELITLLNEAYHENVTSTGSYIFNISDLDMDMSIELPTEITDVEIIIDNSNSGEETFQSFELTVKGLNTQEKEYTALDFTIQNPVTYDDYAKKEGLKTDVQDLIADAEAYVEASDNYHSLDSIAVSIPLVDLDFGIEQTTNVKEIIKDANELYTAQKEYNAGLDSLGNATQNDEMLEKRNEILLYYYSEVLSTEERQYLLYPAMKRLNEMKFVDDDYTAMTVSKLRIEDEDDKATIEKAVFNHFVNGENVKDFTLTYASDDEEIIQIDNNGYFTSAKGGVYNGNVGEGNVKGADRSATISVTATPTADSTLTDSVTKTQTVKYTGEKKHFRALTNTTFKSVDGFDVTTRELTMNVGDTFDIKNLLNLPSNAVTVYTSNDTNLASISTLTGRITAKSPYKEGDSYRNLVGIIANVVTTSGASITREKVVFYVRVNQAS